jgi:hypothetical protein
MNGVNPGDKQDPVIINAPTVEVYVPESGAEMRWTTGMIYSIQLDSGLIVTSPDKFPR